MKIDFYHLVEDGYALLAIDGFLCYNYFSFDKDFPREIAKFIISSYRLSSNGKDSVLATTWLKGEVWELPLSFEVTTTSEIAPILSNLPNSHPELFL